MAPPDPLLPQQQQDGGPPPDDEPGSRGWSVRKWITALGFVLSALTCVVAVYSSNGNSIMLSSFLNFLVLLDCLNRYEKAEPGSESMNRMKLCVWLLAMALAFLFSAQVSYVVPTAVAVVTCVTAVGAVARGLYRYL